MYSYRCIITFQVVHVKEFYYVVKNCVTQLTLLELKKKSLITTTYLTVMKLKTRPSYFPGGGGWRHGTLLIMGQFPELTG